MDETEHKITFEYVDDKTPVVEYQVELTNEKEPESQPGTPDSPASVSTPKTGDDTNIWLFVLAMVLSAVGVTALVIVKKRNK